MTEDNFDVVIDPLLDEKPPSWKPRFIVGIIMICLAFIGMIVTHVKADGAWLYWRIMTPIYAALCIGLSIYMRNKEIRKSIWTIWHEIFHWIGLLLAVLLVNVLVQMGFSSRYQAGIEVLLLLSLSTFLAGVYTEPSFIIIGIALGLFIVVIAFLNQYLYFILVPVILFAILSLYWMSSRRKIKKRSTYEEL
jgi:hypothetical protein